MRLCMVVGTYDEWDIDREVGKCHGGWSRSVCEVREMIYYL